MKHYIALVQQIPHEDTTTARVLRLVRSEPVDLGTTESVANHLLTGTDQQEFLLQQVRELIVRKDPDFEGKTSTDVLRQVELGKVTLHLIQ